MTEPALKLVETNDVETKALSIVDQAAVVKVTDTETYKAAGELWKQIGDMMKEVKGTFEPICDAAHKAWKTAVAKRDSYLDPLMSAQKSVKRLMSDYDLDQERIRKAEEARREEIARKAAEEQALLDAIAAEEEAKRNGATAEEAAQEAQAIIETPVYVPPVVIPKETPKLKGGPVFQKRWDFEVVNESLVPRQYLSVDLVKIRRVVTALKDQSNIPGIKVFETRV